jgi:hypothetical protein
LPELYADGEAAFDAAAVTALRTGAADPDRPRQAPAAASHAPVKGPAPVGLAGSSSPALFVPAPVSVVTKEILVRGPLARSVVEHAIARAEADFHACYSAAVASARRDAAGTARVQLTIDEGGYAGAVSVKGGPLPGMDRCVQEVARQIRTRVPPDVGLATVSFTVVFSVGGPAR